MNWNQHVVTCAVTFLIAVLLVVTGGTWMVLLLVGGAPLAHQVLGDNLVKTFLVITFAFLGITQVIVMAFLWGVLILVGGKWLMYHFRHFWETEIGST
jgi:hypothetical protein